MTMFDKIVGEGFFNSKYLDEELPDELFVKQASRFSQDTQIKVSNKRIAVGGIEASYFHKVDFDDDVVYMGARDIEEVDYYIEHDETVVMPVFDWYVNFMKGSMKPFPYVDVAMPVISANVLEKNKTFAFQRYFMELGFLLVNPTYSEVRYLSTSGGFVAEIPLVENVQRFEDVSDDSRLFLMYETGDVYYDTYKTVGMQFNPFHPFSASKILEIRVEGDVYFGKYKLNNKEYPFEYDMQDTRYRVHSDQWIPAIGAPSYVNEMFDLVGNFEFFSSFYMYDVTAKAAFDPATWSFKEVEVKKKVEVEGRRSILSPVFVEPYISNRMPDKGYSVLGPWDGKVTMGVSDFFFVPYMTPKFTSNMVKGPVDSFFEISQLVQYDDQSRRYTVRNFCDICIGYKGFYDPDCVCDQDIEAKGKKKLRKYSIKNFPYYIRHNESRSYHRIFFPGDGGSFRFIYTAFKVSSYPTKHDKKSIIYPPQMISLISLIAASEYRTVFDTLSINIMPTKKQLGGIIELKAECDNDAIEAMLRDIRVESAYRVEELDRAKFDIIKFTIFNKHLKGSYSNSVLNIEGTKSDVNDVLSMMSNWAVKFFVEKPSYVSEFTIS